jgi:hypothetical protein
MIDWREKYWKLGNKLLLVVDLVRAETKKKMRAKVFKISLIVNS